VVGILDAGLLDEANSWTLQSDGSWARAVADPTSDLGPVTLGFNVQVYFQNQALESLRNRREGLLSAPSAERTASEPDPSVAAAATGDSDQRRRWLRRRR